MTTNATNFIRISSARVGLCLLFSALLLSITLGCPLLQIAIHLIVSVLALQGYFTLLFFRCIMCGAYYNLENISFCPICSSEPLSE